MKFVYALLKICTSIVLPLILLFSSALFPAATFATDIEFSPAVSEVVHNFSGKYCLAISNGRDPEEAAEVASRQMISGLIFSGVLKEVMSISRVEMASVVTTEIFSTCGSDLSISQQDLNDYLVELAESDESQAKSQPKPFNPFGMG